MSSCTENFKKNDCQVMADSIRLNLLNGSRFILVNSIDGSGYHSAELILKNNKNDYPPIYRRIADSVFKDSIRVNFNIPLMESLKEKMIVNGDSVSEILTNNLSLEDIDSNSTYLCFSDCFTISSSESAGYFSIVDLEKKYSNGYYYYISDDSCWVQRIWNSKQNYGKERIKITR